MQLTPSHTSWTTTHSCVTAHHRAGTDVHQSYSFEDLSKELKLDDSVPSIELEPCTPCKSSSYLALDREPVLQAGGRDKGFRIDPSNPNIILKDTDMTEYNFYTSIAPTLDKLTSPQWDGWRPKFHRSEIFINHEGKQKATIFLENLTARAPNQESTNAGVFWNPNAIDIKLGQRLYGSSDPLDKKRRKIERAEESTSAELGVRLSGSKIWDNDKKEYTNFHRKFGFESDPKGHGLQRMFNSFFPILPQENGMMKQELTYADGGLPIEFVKMIIDRSVIPQLHVSKIKWRSYNSSLLIILEGDRTRLEEIMKNEPTDLEKFTHVKMIDFASVEFAEDTDPGLLKGLQTTLQLFKKLSILLE